MMEQGRPSGRSLPGNALHPESLRAGAPRAESWSGLYPL